MANKIEKSRLSNSPFRYAGGKFYARKIILKHIPETEFYCEPFCGGASIFFAKHTSSFNLLNDLDKNVINTLSQIRDNLDGLLSLLQGVRATKELHHHYKNEFKPRNKLEQAFRWYYLNRTSYSGIMKMENCYWGYHEKYSMRPENWPRHLRTVSERLQGVSLSSIDFEDCINSLPDGAFCFVDPPYYNADQQKFYSCNFSQEDHIRLRDCLKRHSERLTFLLTYDDSDEVRDLYSWCGVLEEQSWQYTINRTDDQKTGMKLIDGHKSHRKLGKEIFIKNYDVSNIELAAPANLLAAQ